MLDKSSVDQELARRLCAAFVSYQLGISLATQYKRKRSRTSVTCGISSQRWQKNWQDEARIRCTKTFGRLATTLIQ